MSFGSKCTQKWYRNMFTMDLKNICEFTFLTGSFLYLGALLSFLEPPVLKAHVCIISQEA